MTNKDVPQKLIDPAVIYDELLAATRGAPAGPRSARGTVVEILKGTLERIHVLAEQQLIANGDGTRCAESLSVAEDEMIRALFRLASSELYPAGTSEERIAVVAVGGYGRGTLAPGSDIDLLIILP